MTTPLGRDRSHESVINAVLARFLTERDGLDAVADTLRHGPQPDIVVRLPEGTVVVETEVEPASANVTITSFMVWSRRLSQWS